jgi:hypothetical protein
MQSIREKWHVEIGYAIARSPLPPEFLAALIANETGGDPTKKRFEKGALAQIWEVLLGRSPAFGSISRKDIYQWLPSVSLQEGLELIDGLATSWGLTQIMGYQMIHPERRIHDLQDPAYSLNFSCQLLGEFAKDKGLNVAADFSELLDCWNTGRPHAPTADPSYIPNGLARMAIYRDLGEEPPKVVSA